MAKKKLQKLRMGVIGVGGMGREHCRIIQEKIPEMELVAVTDAFKGAVDSAAAKFKVTPFYSHRELIKSKTCDAVTIATPHPMHAPVAIDCLKAGLHVLSEKPLSERISTATKMVQSAKKHKRVLAVMFQRRFEPQFEAAINMVKSGKLGKIHRATLIAPEYRSQAYYDSGSWRATWEFEGGGVMMNQAPHIIDIFVNLVGRPERVRGATDTRMHKIEVEDVAEATMTMPGGGSGYLYCSTCEPLPAQSIEIFADKGKLLLRDDTIKYWRYTQPISVHIKKAKGMWDKPKVIEVDLKLKDKEKKKGQPAVIRNFARHILKGEKLVCSGESGLASLELANAITLSSFTKQEVKLPISGKKYDDLLKHLRKTSTFKKEVKVDKRITDPGHRS